MHVMTEQSSEGACSFVICWSGNIQRAGQMCKGLVHDQSGMEKTLISKEMDRTGRLFQSGGRQRQEVRSLSNLRQ